MLYKSGINLKSGAVDFIAKNNYITVFSAYLKLDQLKQLEGANQTIGASNIMQNLIPNNSATVSSPSQAPVPTFSSEDPLNVTNLVIRSIYNLIG